MKASGAPRLPESSDHVPAQPFLAATVLALEPISGRVRVTCDPGLVLAASQLTPLAQIVEEAVSNAVRHAYPDGSAGPVWVTLSADRARLKLAVRDHGVGFPILDEHRSPGRGRIRAAADELHGYLRFDNRNYSGAEVTVVFPAA